MPRHRSLRAVIYASSRDLLASCLNYCTRRKYGVTAVVADPGGWPSAVEMVTAGRAEVIVVATREDLPRDRLPRIEAVDEAGAAARRLTERTRVIRWSAPSGA